MLLMHACAVEASSERSLTRKRPLEAVGGRQRPPIQPKLRHAIPPSSSFRKGIEYDMTQNDHPPLLAILRKLAPRCVQDGKSSGSAIFFMHTFFGHAITRGRWIYFTHVRCILVSDGSYCADVDELGHSWHAQPLLE